MENTPRSDDLNTYPKWWKSKPLLAALAIFFAIAAVIVPLVLSAYPPGPTNDVVESPAEKETDEEPPGIQQR